MNDESNSTVNYKVITAHIRKSNNLQPSTCNQTIYIKRVVPINYHFIIHVKYKLPIVMQHKYHRMKQVTTPHYCQTLPSTGLRVL